MKRNHEQNRVIHVFSKMDWYDETFKWCQFEVLKKAEFAVEHLNKVNRQNESQIKGVGVLREPVTCVRVAAKLVTQLA